jgi:hypothetical protein
MNNLSNKTAYQSSFANVSKASTPLNYNANFEIFKCSKNMNLSDNVNNKCDLNKNLVFSSFNNHSSTPNGFILNNRLSQSSLNYEFLKPSLSQSQDSPSSLTFSQGSQAKTDLLNNSFSSQLARNMGNSQTKVFHQIDLLKNTLNGSMFDDYSFTNPNSVAIRQSLPAQSEQSSLFDIEY